MKLLIPGIALKINIILWSPIYIYTSAERITAAHVNIWNTNSSWPSNRLGFCSGFTSLVLVKFFALAPGCSTLRDHFCMKCTIHTSPYSYFAVQVLIPVITDFWDALAKLKTSDVSWYCHAKSICHSLGIGAFTLPLLILPRHAKNFSRKLLTKENEWHSWLSFYSTVALAQSDLHTIIAY